MNSISDIWEQVKLNFNLSASVVIIRIEEWYEQSSFFSSYALETWLPQASSLHQEETPKDQQPTTKRRI